MSGNVDTQYVNESIAIATHEIVENDKQAKLLHLSSCGVD